MPGLLMGHSGGMTNHETPMPSSEPAPPSDNTTLTEVVDGYREAGFAGDFGAEEGASIRCGACGAVIDARRFAMHSIRRLEGASDPADMVVVAATTCPVCGSQGTIVLGYGPMASATDADVLMAMQDRRDDDVLPPDAGPGEMPIAADAIVFRPV